MSQHNFIYRSICVLALGFLLIFSTNTDILFALSSEQRRVIDSGARFFNVEDYDLPQAGCSNSTYLSSAETNSGSNTDYAGRQILADAQLQAIAENQPFYENAAVKVSIPWQMLAVIHLRESGLKKSNPANGQGIYQFSDKRGGPYPTGPVSDSEFQRQTDLAAEFLKAKASSNYTGNRELTPSSGASTVKDTFFSYNGRASAYETQAKSLGYGANEGFEGSPYVMNKADKQRDPEANPTGWGQIKKDGGGIEYPANNDYGAFVVYASLAGIKLGDCKISEGEFVWPEVVPSTITSCYGPRTLNGETRQHNGIDIAAGEGSPIYAVAAGEVTFAGDVSGYGPNFVAIKHANGFSTSYGHMSAKTVSVGDTVSQGEQIGEEGNEGISFGSHLHFNLFPGEYSGDDSNNVNPLKNGLSVPEGVSNPNNCQ